MMVLGVRSWLVVGVTVVSLALGSCERGDHGSAPPTPTAGIFAAPPTASRAISTPSIERQAREALPRSVSDVALGMSHAEIQQSLGKLTCEDKPAGHELCTGTHNTGTTARNLEVFFYQKRVFSLSYEAATPDNIWSYLDSRMAAYGEPVLKGLTERDRQGRLHEIYGWKDEATIYSVRFIWEDEEEDQRSLSTVAIAIWDREAYLEWESKVP